MSFSLFGMFACFSGSGSGGSGSDKSDPNGSDKSSAGSANGLGESGSGGSEEGSDKGRVSHMATAVHVMWKRAMRASMLPGNGFSADGSQPKAEVADSHVTSLPNQKHLRLEPLEKPSAGAFPQGSEDSNPGEDSRSESSNRAALGAQPCLGFGV